MQRAENEHWRHQNVGTARQRLASFRQTNDGEGTRELTFPLVLPRTAETEALERASRIFDLRNFVHLSQSIY
jgi:hypothetical protein